MKTEKEFIGKYVIVRADRAGVFAGTLLEKEGTEVVMTDVRRIWYWDGAASLSQLAISGTLKPATCKFPAPLEKILVLGVVEVIPCTKEAEKSIKAVKVWEQS